jgi:hypothetical protein
VLGTLKGKVVCLALEAQSLRLSGLIGLASIMSLLATSQYGDQEKNQLHIERAKHVE